MNKNEIKEVTELLKSILEEQQLIRKELQDINNFLKPSKININI